MRVILHASAYDSQESTTTMTSVPNATHTHTSPSHSATFTALATEATCNFL